MKQMKVLSVLVAALALGLSACGGGKTPCKTHKWGEWEVTKPATCTEDGEESHKCTVCGEVKTRKIPAAHSYGDWVVTQAPTCTEKGSHQRTCSVCNDVQVEDVPATGHTWGEWDVTQAPTCTEVGSRQHTCSVCQAVESEEVPAAGHTWGEWVDTKPAKCEEKGEHQRTCSVCNQVETEETAALGHHLVQQADDGTAVPAGDAKVRVYECDRDGCDYATFGFKATEVSENAGQLVDVPYVDPATGEQTGEIGKRFWGRPIGNAMELSEDGSASSNDDVKVFDRTVQGDLFEYRFTLTQDQVNALGEDVACYADATPANYLGGQDFWACDPNAQEWTPGYYIDDAHEDQTPIADYRYILYVDDQPVQFDSTMKAPVTADGTGQGNNQNLKRHEFLMPYVFHFTPGQHKISLRMAGGYRSVFYNFIFKSFEAPEVPPEPPVEDEWVEDTVTVMPTPAADGALVKRYVKEGKDDVKYEIAVATSNITSADSGAWKTDPSTGAFKLNNGKTATFKFDLPKAFEGKMYQTCYMDSYNSNKTKKMFYETNNHCNIEVKVNNNAIDFSQFATTTFQQVLGDETDGTNSLTKDVELGDVVLQGANVITYKRVETLNMIVKGFVFIGKDHDHAYVAGDKAANSALRVAACECGDSGYELQAADLTEGQKAPVSSDKDTRLGKNIFDDVWNITGIKAGTYDLYLNAQNSANNDNAYWNAATAIAKGDRASNNGSTPELQAEYRYKVKIDSGEYTPIANDTERYSDFGLSNAKAAWTTKPVARLVIAEGAASLTIHNMNNGYSIWIYAARLMPVAA